MIKFFFRTTCFRIHSERKRFVFYALYAYGTPFLLTLITAILDYTQPFPDYLLPGVGTQTLFLKPKKSMEKNLTLPRQMIYSFIIICKFLIDTHEFQMENLRHFSTFIC